MSLWWVSLNVSTLKIRHTIDATDFESELCIDKIVFILNWTLHKLCRFSVLKVTIYGFNVSDIRILWLIWGPTLQICDWL